MSLPKQFLLLVFIVVLKTETKAQTLNQSEVAIVTDSLKNNYTIAAQPLLIDSLIDFGKKFLHKPYNYRPNSQTRFDCSGFASYVYGNFGYALKRSSYEQAEQFDKIHRDQLKTGDLVFFSGRRNNKQVGHVGIVVTARENGQFDFIHSSNHSGIVISTSEEDYYARRYIKAGRVINDSSCVALLPVSASENTVATFIAENTTNPSAINESPQITPTKYHRVEKGDTLYGIARKYSISVNDLKKNNQLSGNIIQPKQRLKISD